MKTELIQTLDWEVKTQPVLYSTDKKYASYPYYESIVEDRNYMHLSKSSGQSLAIMSNKYVPMTIEDFTRSVENLSEVSNYPIEGFQEFNGGRIILGILKRGASIQATIPSENYIIVGSSFNGSKPFFIGTSMILIRCQNAFSQISIFDTVKHTKSSPLKRDQLYNYFTAYLRDQKGIDENFERMDEVKVSNLDKLKYAKSILSISNDDKIPTVTQNRLDRLMLCINSETKEVGNTAFGMFQGVTKYTTHELNSKDDVFGNIFGIKDYYNQRAYNQALKLVA